ncbi:MAG TPA: hypothetical protein ENJ60_16500 [Aeromonadales bacterium]|nr:hypothetical protein [Aeromonadales bacterium]
MMSDNITRFVQTVMVSLLVSGCITVNSYDKSKPDTNIKPSPDHKGLETLYDYQLIESENKKPVSMPQLVKQLKKSDVVFVGELHTHQASHKLQMDLLQVLYRQNPNLVLSMEQFSRDAQPVIDGYLAGKYGEETLFDEADAWKDYKGSYRAVVEFAREHQIPVIAANAPAMFVRCVGKKGAAILKKVPQQKRDWSARELDLKNKKYKAKFMDFIKESGRNHGQTEAEMKKRQLNTYAAQLLRDTTMAESIALARKRYPRSQIIHLNGAFHSDNHLGTVAVLETTHPEISTTVISPIMVEEGLDPKLSGDDYKQGDYLYLVKPLPERYLDKEKENASIRKLIKKRVLEKCEL